MTIDTKGNEGKAMQTRTTYADRLSALRAAKLDQTREKIALTGSKDHDDHGIVLPPPDRREIVQTMSSSGMPITDCLLSGYAAQSNHPSGGFFGPRLCGENFRQLLDAHPPYVDPRSSLAGAYMANFMSYRKPHWNPDIRFDDLRAAQKQYNLGAGIGATQHFCQDLAIGMELGFGGLLAKVQRFAAANPTRAEFYAGLEAVVLGLQNWVRRTAQAAAALAETEQDAGLRANLREVAELNFHLVEGAPRTLREACQWILWYDMAARMYNGSGALGRLDVILQPFYERDVAAGILDDEEATFHIACLLLRDTAYLQLGGPDASGRDVTSRVSYLVLEAAHLLKIPANVGVAVGESTDPGLLRRGVEILFADKTGIPKFLGVDETARGFARNGFELGLGYERAYAGCHWSAIPGREYTLNDCVKINFAAVFEAAWREMIEQSPAPSVSDLWQRYESHLGRAVDTIAAGLDVHMAHMHEVFPELVLDLLCHGPIEQGVDASHGGVEFTNLCVDGSALATVADSFAAVEQRVEREGRLTWAEVDAHLRANWGGPGGERARLLLKGTPRYASGGSRADEWAVRLTQAFTRLVTEKSTPAGYRMIPGLFSWANTIPMGKAVGATPNGRRAGEPITHGSNPEPGFRKDGAPTAMAVAIASVQPGFGNTAPMQMEVDPALSNDREGVDAICNLIETHFRLGGTQINMNILDAEKVLEAHADPSKYPDLVVRVTGFSAYFASLSPEFRQLVVDRMIKE